MSDARVRSIVLTALSLCVLPALAARLPVVNAADQDVKEKQAATAKVAPDKAAAQVEELIRAEMKQHKIPGISLAVLKEGSAVLVKGFGLANVELNVPATPETVYQIQSMTKSFTASATMMLIEEGKLALDAPVSKYLEGTPDTWKNITLRHLLSHTSGIKDFINEPTASLRLDVSEAEVFRATAPRPLNFHPGERYAYSNTNYHLLAMIIRKLTGKSYGNFLRERILDPLGMNHTRVINFAEIIPNRAAGYGLESGELRNGDYVAVSILGYGGGGLRSTVLDLAKWDAALYTEKLLKGSSLQAMWTPAKLNNGKTIGYGFGWTVSTVNGHKCVAHTGAHMTGFTSAMCRFLDDKLTVIVLTNARHAAPERIAHRVAGIYVPDLVPDRSKAAKP